MASGARWGLIPCWIEQPMLLRWGKMASGARWGLILPEPVHFRHSSLGKMASGARWGLIPISREMFINSSAWAKWPVEPVGD